MLNLLDFPFLHVAAPLMLIFTIATLVLLWYTKKLENRLTCWTAGLVVLQPEQEGRVDPACAGDPWLADAEKLDYGNCAVVS